MPDFPSLVKTWDLAKKSHNSSFLSNQLRYANFDLVMMFPIKNRTFEQIFVFSISKAFHFPDKATVKNASLNTQIWPYLPICKQEDLENPHFVLFLLYILIVWAQKGWFIELNLSLGSHAVWSTYIHICLGKFKASTILWLCYVYCLMRCCC